MKKSKLIPLILCVLLLSAVSACATNVPKPTEPTAVPSNGSPAPVSERTVSELREQYPEYFNLDTMKGLELYLWRADDNNVYCGLLPGTERVKTNDEIRVMETRGVLPEEMRDIMSTYGLGKGSVLMICLSRLTEGEKNAAAEIFGEWTKDSAIQQWFVDEDPSTGTVFADEYLGLLKTLRITDDFVYIYEKTGIEKTTVISRKNMSVETSAVPGADLCKVTISDNTGLSIEIHLSQSDADKLNAALGK